MVLYRVNSNRNRERFVPRPRSAATLTICCDERGYSSKEEAVEISDSIAVDKVIFQTMNGDEIQRQ